MIVKQKKMDKRLKYKINLDTIYASAVASVYLQLKLLEFRVMKQKKYLKHSQKKNYQKLDIVN